MAAGSAGERLATTETLCPLSSGEVDERVGESLDVAGSSGESELQYLDTGTGARNNPQSIHILQQSFIFTYSDDFDEVPILFVLTEPRISRSS